MRVAVVIPCYRVGEAVLEVLKSIGPEVSDIFVVDDACPMNTGKLVREKVRDSRVRVVELSKNQGVGGATLAGFASAAEAGAQILVKLDGDGQMNPALISRLIRPIAQGSADYVKGNRFSHPNQLRSMPMLRLWGNSALSFIAKASTGYWKIMDPTNGFVAIHREVFLQLPHDRIEKRFFFETDLLYRLGRIGAVVRDFSMHAVYGEEKSNLRISKVLPEFAFKHARNLLKRIADRYFINDFNAGSLELLLGTVLCAFGSLFGAYHWWLSARFGVLATTGTVMIATLPVILGFQLLLSFLNYDLTNQPDHPLQAELDINSEQKERT